MAEVAIPSAIPTHPQVVDYVNYCNHYQLAARRIPLESDDRIVNLGSYLGIFLEYSALGC